MSKDNSSGQGVSVFRILATIAAIVGAAVAVFMIVKKIRAKKCKAVEEDEDLDALPEESLDDVETEEVDDPAEKED